MALSSRAHELSKPDPKFMLWDILQDMYHPEANPTGYVSLGVAENTLMHDTLSEHIHKHMALPNDEFTYGDGKKRLRATLSRFLTRHLKPLLPILPEHISVTNGCSSAVEHVAWAFGNPGDGFLLGKPFYGTFVPDVTLRMGTELLTVDFDGEDPLGKTAAKRYEDRIIKAKEQGKKIAGLILAHPHNPLGRCYSRIVLVQLLELCNRHQVHFISDEIYALSTFTNTVDTSVEIHPFESILSLNVSDYIDPAYVHAIWGISKDFGANGLRLGAVISQSNPKLHAALTPVSLYSSSSALTDHAAANFLDDEAWVDMYVKENRQQLAENYKYVTSWAKKNDIEYAPGVNAAFFLWVNLGKAYGASHQTTESDLDQDSMAALLRERVFLASGVQFGSEKPGWFRIVFSQKREYLDMGLQRIVAAIGRSGDGKPVAQTSKLIATSEKGGC